MIVITRAIRKTGKIAVVPVKSSSLVYSKVGITKQQAARAFISGWMKGARPKINTKYKGAKGFKFIIR